MIKSGIKLELRKAKRSELCTARSLGQKRILRPVIYWALEFRAWNLWRWWTWVGLASALLLVGSPVPVEAHVLQTDGPIGAVLHIDPEDDPIVGQTATFFFEFKDTQGTFDANQCDCNAALSQDGKQLLSQPISGLGQGPSLTSASFAYVFPQKGVYILTVTGKPTSGGSFHQFKLVYNLRVDRTTGGSTPSTASTQAIWKYGIVLSGVVLLFGLMAYDRFRDKQRVAQPESGRPKKEHAAAKRTPTASHSAIPAAPKSKRKEQT